MTTKDARRCEKLLTDGTHCPRTAVARVIPSIEDPRSTTGWLACPTHADRAENQMRRAGADVGARIRSIDDTYHA